MSRPLDRLLFAQGGLCFFCEQPLPKGDASVEHLVASAKGGSNADDNCVVCCKTVNALLGSMSLKEKIRVVLNQKGHFKCPNGAGQAVDMVMKNLSQRGDAKPKTVKTLTGTIRTLCGKDASEENVAAIIEALRAGGFILVDGTKVAYPQ